MAQIEAGPDIIVDEERLAAAVGYYCAVLVCWRAKMGRNLTAFTFFATSVLGATAIQQYGNAKAEDKNLQRSAVATNAVFASGCR